ncbi:hypothetical protein GCM10010123_36480 [Pilimelia anulata]|uniref:DNRLRE domain-containing protein n=2 Tax=Pilimelia anulata TaxID=53371 RepID=A0A8J3B945_9ACTN|nr:hypothetical protein GCM10010123_36480 [Pilimelia anulata]
MLDVPARAAGTDAAPDEATAVAAARAGGERVRITGLTTETDEAWALPDGTVEWSHHYRPVRLERDGDWVPVDTTLEVRPDGTVGPRAAAADMAFSGGGTEPLVALAKEDSTVAFGSPLGALPTPVLDGDTATYPEVLPGVDLRLRADVDGYAQQLVVKSEAAAANPELDRLTFPMVREDATVRADAAGNLTVADATGAELFIGATPTMWDQDFADAHRDTGGQPDPAHHGVEEEMAVAVTADSLSIVPDAAMLADPDTTYPVYIDPGYTAPRRNWTYTSSATPNTNFWNSGADAPIGTPNAGATKYRSYFVENADNIPWTPSDYLVSAKLQLQLEYSASCVPMEFSAYSLTSSPGLTTTWNSQPGINKILSSATTNLGRPGCADPGTVKLDVTSLARNSQLNGWNNVNIGLKATSETDTRGYKTFSNNPKLVVVYTSYPRFVANAMLPGGACATGAGRPVVNTATPALAAEYSDSDSTTADVTVEWWDVNGTAPLGSTTLADADLRLTPTAAVPGGQLAHLGTYKWRSRASDSGAETPWSDWCEFTVDTTVPDVSSLDYPENAGGGPAGSAGTFAISPPPGMPDVATYTYWLNGGATTQVAADPANPVAVTVTPTTSGDQVLSVVARSSLGVDSPARAYRFRVGADALAALEPVPSGGASGTGQMETSEDWVSTSSSNVPPWDEGASASTIRYSPARCTAALDNPRGSGAAGTAGTVAVHGLGSCDANVSTLSARTWLLRMDQWGWTLVGDSGVRRTTGIDTIRSTAASPSCIGRPAGTYRGTTSQISVESGSSYHAALSRSRTTVSCTPGG